MEELDDLLLGAHHIRLVAHLGHEAAVGHDGLPVAHGGAHEHSVGVLLVVFKETDSCDAVAFQNGEADHLHQPPGEALHAEGGGHPQQPGDFLGGGVLGVDNHVQADLTLEEVGLPVVLRGADAGHGVPGPQLLGDEAADDVQLVGPRHRHHQLRILHPGLPEGLDGGAAALHAHQVQGAVGHLHGLSPVVQEHQLMVFTA